jgi:Protein of unknown function (DUF1552)
MKTQATPQTNEDQASARFANLSRRRFLRGLGACMALPAFESLRPLSLFAAPAVQTVAGAAAKAAPVRMAFLYVPNGIIPSGWWPEGDGGSDFQLPSTLQPLEKVRQKIQVISGLEDISANAGADGGGDHARAGGTFLTGVRIKKTSGSDIHSGISIDQVVGQQIGHLTRFSSLELSCDAIRKAGDCDSGYSCAYEYNLAWKSPNQPVTPETNPRLAFERLFGAGSPQQRAANLKQRQQEQHSILDFVMDDAGTLQKQLSGRDQEKLDQYLTSVRELEQRIQKAEQMPVANPLVEAPSGIPPEFAEHIQLMFDTMVLAFQTDSTRIASMLIAAEGSNRTFSEIGLSAGHHSLSHHRNDPDTIAKVKQIDLWYAKQLGKFLEKMDATKDVDGNSLLHNSMIVYGSGNADGNRHTHTNLPILLAGAGGGTLQTGRYVKATPAPLTNLFLSMADRMGATGIERHGDSTGRLTII